MYPRVARGGPGGGAGGREGAGHMDGGVPAVRKGLYGMRGCACALLLPGAPSGLQ